MHQIASADFSPLGRWRSNWEYGGVHLEKFAASFPEFYMRTFKMAVAGLALFSFAISCSAKSSTAPRTDIITVSAEQTTTSIMAGATLIIGITVTRPIGYTGPITLTTDGAPTGVTATLSPSTLAPNANTSTLTLIANAGAIAGTGSVTIRASGTGIDSQSATINLTVGSTAQGNFTLSVSPASMTVSRGQSSSAIITIAPTGGFTDAVSLAVQGLPATISASISPGTTSSGSATLAIQVATGTQTGTYTGTVSAQSSSGITQTASFSVTVLGSGIRAR
jgi:hypothetical protein